MLIFIIKLGKGHLVDDWLPTYAIQYSIVPYALIVSFECEHILLMYFSGMKS